MSFDPTISGGSILQALVLLIAFVVAFTRIGGRIDLLTQRMQSVEDAIKDHRGLERRIIVLEERATNQGKTITIIQSDVSGLKRGQGFITSHRTSLDGEYE
jgi:uncharacterized coiled-coil protein SlyX